MNLLEDLQDIVIPLTDLLAQLLSGSQSLIFYMSIILVHFQDLVLGAGYDGPYNILPATVHCWQLMFSRQLTFPF